jgi:thioredoxin 1
MLQPGSRQRQQVLLIEDSDVSARSPGSPSAALIAAALVAELTLGITGCTPSSSASTAAASTEDAVQQALRAGKPTVAEFGANACAACREMKPVLEALRREHGERIAVVDVDLIKQKEAGYLRRYRIQLMPTQVFFDAQGRETSRHMGTISSEEIIARLEGSAP